MIIDQAQKLSAYGSSSHHEASSATEHLLVDIGGSPTGVPLTLDEPPPSFTAYTAEFFLDSKDNVVSHDPHLNTDGEALYRFLLSQSHVLPTLRITFKGKHDETKLRWVDSTDAHGHTTSRSELYTETVTDFDFCIDVRPDHLKKLGEATRDQDDAGYIPVHWSVGDDEPAFRGRMVQELEIPELTISSLVGASRRRKAIRKDVSRYLEWVRKRQQMGFPPWMREEDGVFFDRTMQSFEESSASLRSSKTLRQWADEYCASPKRLKEFVYQKVLYGWNFAQLEESLRSLVLLSPYNGDLEITFTNYSSKIYIRPSNRLSRMLSNKWLKFLSIILLIYPFIWLFKRFHRMGGGVWEVCGGAYPLKQWVPVSQKEILPPDVQQEETLPPYGSDETSYQKSTFGRNPTSMAASSSNFDSHLDHRSPRPRYIQTPSGMKKLIGMKEGEWFRNWEALIIRAVIGKYSSTVPLRMEAFRLDGYDETTGPLIRE